MTTKDTPLAHPVRRRPLTDLRPHPRNARNGDTDAIADSLRANGQYRPIVTTTDGTILAGNHTYAAAMEVGLPALDCVVLDLDPESDDAVRIMLADNGTNDRARNDDGLLLDLLRSLSDPYTGTGYYEDDVAVLAARVDLPLRADGSPPEEFPAYDEDAALPFRCPSCSYEWSGAPR